MPFDPKIVSAALKLKPGQVVRTNRTFVPVVKPPERLDISILSIISLYQSFGVVEALSWSHERRGDFWFPCPFHNEATSSFHVVEGVKGSFYKCFGCGEGGGSLDLLEKLETKRLGRSIFQSKDDVVALARNLKNAKKLENVSVEVSAERQKHSGKSGSGADYIIEVCASAPDIAPHFEPRRETSFIIDPITKQALNYRPARVHVYHDQEGRRIGYVLRLEYIDDNGKKNKIPLPVQWCKLRNPGGAVAQGWTKTGFLSPRPLYRLFDLVSSDKPILLVEGEKAADEVAKLYGDIPEHYRPFEVAAWPGGTNAINEVDFKPIAGRKIIYWPDKDDPGVKCALGVFSILRKLGCEISIIRPPAWAGKGWDLADAVLDNGWTLGDIQRYLDSPNYFTSDEINLALASSDTSISLLRAASAL